MSDRPSGYIPGSDLAEATPGPFDSVIGVNRDTGALRRFPADQLPANDQISARVRALESGQGSGMVGFLTKSSMEAETGLPEGTLALVTEDPVDENNRAYTWTGAAWSPAKDRVSRLSETLGRRISTTEGEVWGREVVGAAGPLVPGSFSFIVGETRVFTSPVLKGGRLESVDLFNLQSSADAVIIIRRFAKDGDPGAVAIGDNFSQVGPDMPVTVPAAAPGGSEVTASVGVDVEAGEYLGFFIPPSVQQPAGVNPLLRWVSSAAPTRYAYAPSPGNYTSFEVGNIEASRGAQIRFNILPTASRIEVLGGQVDSLAWDILGRGGIGSGDEIVRGADGFLSGGMTRFFTQPAAADGRIDTLEIFNGYPASESVIVLRRFRKDSGGPVTVGDLMTQVGNDVIVAIPPAGVSGGAPMSIPLGIEVNRGDYLGFYIPIGAEQPDGVIPTVRYDNDPANETVYAYGPSGDLSQFTVGTIYSGRHLRMRFGVTGVVQGLSHRLETMEAHAPFAAPGLDVLPPPSAGRMGVILGPGGGVIWGDGENWRWAADNEVAGLYINAHAAATMRLSDGALLFGRAPDMPQTPASTTKILTALVVREVVSDAMLGDIVEFTTADQAGGSTAGLMVGDELSFEDLLYGLMLPSGNDAARCLARVVGDMLQPGGGTAAFVARMNSLAASLGATNSNFFEPAGLSSSGRSTANDLARIAAAYNADAILATVAGTLQRQMTIYGPNDRTYTVQHSIDPDGAVKIPEFAWGKTGTLNGYGSVVIAWDHGGERYITSILRASPAAQRFNDARRLMDQVIAGA